MKGECFLLPVVMIVMVLSNFFSVYRLQSEVDEVLGNKESVSAEDLEKLQYTEQVCALTENTIEELQVASNNCSGMQYQILCCYYRSKYICFHAHLLNLQVLLETLRMYPPIWGIRRSPGPGGIKVGGYHIPEGTHIGVGMIPSIAMATRGLCDILYYVTKWMLVRQEV